MFFWLASTNQQGKFAERFKYDVISSTLLATSVTATPLSSHVLRRSFSPDPTLPGQLVHTEKFHAPSSPLVAYTLLVLVALVAVSQQYYFCAALIIGLSVFFANLRYASNARNDEVETLDALNGLKEAGSVWDSTVNESITILEREERSAYSGATTPSSPSSPLRVALHSSLLTTQAQCDNVRTVLAALTSPRELSQLSEMYAPASPVKASFSLSREGSIRDRTVSLTELPSEITTTDKRATWNGSYASLAGIDPISTQMRRRRSQRRSDVTAMMMQDSISTSVSAPATPSQPYLAGVEEDSEPVSPTERASGEHFGVAALGLRRKRQMRGLEALHLTGKRSTPSMRAPLASVPSRLTTLQPPRHQQVHPLSLSALHHALQGALAAKRYACAHLLALRFDEDDDASYWEDVRAVIALLASALTDAGTRLGAALDDAAREREREEQPTPNMENSDDALSPERRASLALPPLIQHQQPLSTEALRRTHQPRTSMSFAPMPSDLARFAAHVDTLSSALDDAREHLQKCVSALHEDPLREREPADSSFDPLQEPPALLAFDNVRRELGLAIRECERGRSALTDVFATRRSTTRHRRHMSDEDDGSLPALAPDNEIGSSGESDDRPDGYGLPATPHASPPVSPHATAMFSSRRSREMGVNGEGLETVGVEDDDATAHLLLGATARALVPPGIEQVFEADTDGAGGFVRPRAKLSREERIRLSKVRRARGVTSLNLFGEGVVGVNEEDDDSGVPTLDAGRGNKGWGPGGEVVQELKDVIWKVGERRRRMVEGSGSGPVLISEETPLESTPLDQ
ncbi:hypothetical protein BD410DRAFT_800466 [Rickenella mellea]|uniref:Uncharacterized protein n=1 Tax=Rickenella mellea TaxID=50990 RepID=A0A4Y7QHS1_9AGAM|nr:hypothetical protein BD410DRAFT_800466 [Rickenella mellea]